MIQYYFLHLPPYYIPPIGIFQVLFYIFFKEFFCADFLRKNADSKSITKILIKSLFSDNIRIF